MKFVAFPRTKQGTGASRRLRTSGRAPGIVYGGSAEPTLIELDHNALWHAIKKEAFHSSILEMELDGKSSQVLLRDLQVHPYRQQVLHADFQRVDAKTRLTMKVPVHFNGAELSEAVKTDKCFINHVMNELEVTCLPADLPEAINIDLSGLTKGASIHVNDIKLPKGVKIVTHGNRSNPAIVTAVPPLVEEIVTPAAAAPTAEPAKKGKK